MRQATAPSERRRPPPAGPQPRLGKTVFLARSLDHGGAERQLVILACGMHLRGHEVTVVLFYPGGALEGELREAGVPVRAVGKRGRWDVARFFVRLASVLREERPAVLHSYLDLPNLVALSIKPFLARTRLVWGIRASDMDLRYYDWLAGLSFRALCLTARLPDLVIVNSHAGWEHHRRSGFAEHRMRVIPNGIDTDRFVPDPAAGGRVREEWGLAPDEQLVGLVGRLDPMKDHQTFLQAAAMLVSGNHRVRFVCVGNGPAEYREQLLALAGTLGIADRVSWVPARNDLVGVYNALDVICSASAFGEGFSNVIAEAMACGVPCVATDVGDSRSVIGDTGIVVPPRDPAALAGALRTMLAAAADQKHASVTRSRIQSHFSVDRLLDRTEEALWPKD